MSFPRCAVIAGEWNLFAVADQIGRVIRVRVNLIVIAEEHIETMLLWHAGRVATAAAPLAEPASRIAQRLQDRGDRHLFRPQRRAAAVRSHRGVTAVLAGHQTTPRRRTHRRTGKQVAEDDSASRHLVEVRCLNVLATHETRFIIAEFIGHDVNDVGPRVCGDRRGTQQRNRCNQAVKNSWDRFHRCFILSIP